MCTWLKLHFGKFIIDMFLFQGQVALLSKFIYTAKLCLDLRNYATAVAVIEGLENVIVRQVPVRMVVMLSDIQVKMWFRVNIKLLNKAK